MRDSDELIENYEEACEEHEEEAPKYLTGTERIHQQQDWIEQQREARNAARVKAELWRRYSGSAPGADREEFERAYPELLEAYRRNAAAGGDALKLDTPDWLDPEYWDR